jgi:hypothetical protein
MRISSNAMMDISATPLILYVAIAIASFGDALEVPLSCART